jgi:Protein of unknown function (DUF2442)
MGRKLFGTEYEKAVSRARREASTSPRAVRAHYNCSSREVVVELANKTKFSFPYDLAQGLAEASDEDLARIEISPSGAGLHWPRLIADFSVAGLMRGVFGTETWMRSLQGRASRKKRIIPPIKAH